MANSHPNFTNIFNDFMPPQRDPFAGFDQFMRQQNQDALVTEALRRVMITQSMGNNPLTDEAFMQAWEQAKAGVEPAREVVQATRDPVTVKPQQDTFLGDDLIPEPFCTVVDEAGNPMPWSEE